MRRRPSQADAQAVAPASLPPEGLPGRVAFRIEHAVGHVAEFTDPKPPATIRPHLFIGPVSLHDHRLIEVFVNVRTQNFTVFHVMYATEDNLSRIGRSYRP